MSNELRYNRRQGFSLPEINIIETVCGVSPTTGVWTDALVAAVKKWQTSMNISPDGKIMRSLHGNTWPVMLKAYKESHPGNVEDNRPESRVATDYVESLGVRKKLYSPRKTFSAVVVHTTGAGPIRRWKQEQSSVHKKASPFETALRIYSQIMEPGPHYVVGQDGQCVQVCPEAYAAWHVGANDSKAYFSEGWMRHRYDWWSLRWPHLAAPVDLADGMLWNGHSCNANTVGIEVVPPTDNVRGQWSDACRKTLVSLINDICDRCGIPKEDEHILSHSDAHPIRRTTTDGDPWDPYASQWTGWLDLS